MSTADEFSTVEFDANDVAASSDATLIPALGSEPAYSARPLNAAPFGHAHSAAQVNRGAGGDRRSLDNRYDRIAELGRGGCGVVDRAFDVQLGREVAVKRIIGSREVSQDARQRFLHEAKITSQLQHPGVVPVHELGTSSNGDSYYVMKLLEGNSLRHHIQTIHQPADGTLPQWTNDSLKTAIAPLLDRFIDVCNAVGYAHQRGVIHRDLKPANVMVGGFGETIVVDWGLAKRFQQAETANDEGDKRSVPQMLAGANAVLDRLRSVPGMGDHSPDQYQQTTHGTIVGTPAYMSPEQALGEVETLSPKADIFSLGVILYEIIVGKNPHSGMGVIDIVTRIRGGQWEAPRKAQACVAKALDAICQKATSFDPDSRYESTIELANDVRRFLAGEIVSAYQEPLADRIVRWCRRHRTLTTAIATSALALLMSSIVFGVAIHHAHQNERAARLASQLAHQAVLRSLAETREAADSWLIDLSGSLELYPGLQSLRSELIDHAKTQYMTLIDESVALDAAEDHEFDNHDPFARLEQAKCHLRLGDLFRLSNQSVDAAQHYQMASDIVAGLSRNLRTDADDPFTDMVHLQQINVVVGRVQLAPDQTEANDLRNETALDDAAAWLVARLAASGYAADRPSDKGIDSMAARFAAALVRLQLARQHRVTYSLGTASGGGLLGLIEAAKWSRWLANERGKPSDIRLAETIQHELAMAQEAAKH